MYEFIINTVALHYRPQILEEATPWGVLRALKKQVAPTGRA
jgi:hypothetical protein